MTGPRAMRSSRGAWWGPVLTLAAFVLFGSALAVRVGCRRHGCGWPAGQRLLDLDAVGSLPRLFTTGLFCAVALCAVVAGRRVDGRARAWWSTLAGVSFLLAAAKLVSAHSAAKSEAFDATLVGGVLVSAVTLGTLWLAARRSSVPAGPQVTLALALYAAAALGLDLVTGAVAGLADHHHMIAAAGAKFVEELAEALAALLVLVRVRAWLPARPVQSTRQQ